MSYPIRPDRSSDRRMKRAVLLFVVAMLCVGGSLAWVIATRQGREASGPEAVAACGSIFFVLATVPYVVYARLWMGFLYRCPKCGARIKSPLPTAAEDGAPIRHRCDRCRIEWDTGWKYARGGD